MMKTNRRKNISALQLRSLAGRAPHERGSALLIVIGTLALVAVFAAVYVSIGRTDRRAAQTFRNRVEQQDKSFQFAEYLSGIIGDDRLDAYVQYDINGNPFARREVVDVVYTDWSRRSEVNLGVNSEEALLFTPTGRPYRMEGLTATTDFRVQNDPWLAATTPTFLGDPGQPDNPLSGNDDRPFGKLLPFDINRPNAGGYLDQRDWLQISNFAPDGRPVNLFNLRPTLPDGNYRAVGGSNTAVGGFDAEPGFGTSPRASDGRPIRRMSNFLSLLNVQDQGDAQTFLHAFDPASPVSAGNPAGGGVWVQGYNDPQNIGITGTDLYNIPAVWTMNQRFMFMPMNQPFVILNRLGNESSWADPDYPAYQYADADGDGFADSRWFELRSARDLGAGDAFGSARDDIQDLFEQGDMRYFFAARAIDLSSMVNINTATDGLVTPSVAYPMGSSPAEIDLRRLLTMQDQAENYVAMTSTAGPNFLPLSLNAAPRPYAESEIIATPRVWDNATRPDEDFRRAPEDYQFYQADLTDMSVSTIPNDIREPLANSPSMLIGRYAYSALRRAIRMGGTPGNQFRGFDLESGGSATSARDLIQFETMDPNSPTSMPITAQERYEQYIEIGRQYSANPGLVTSSAGLFGIDDLSELLTFHGLNDPDFTSRLERVVDGRFVSGTGDPIQTRRLSPLLSNRDLTLDRFGHTRILSTVDMRTAPYLDNLTDLTRIGEISRNSMALMALTPRKRMTTLSGFVPLSPDERLTDASELSALTGGSALPTLENLMLDPQALFGLYSGALAGEIEDLRGLGWVNDIDLFDNQFYSPLFYGYRGPELALHTAASAAVNMKDMADADRTPTIATVLLDRNQRNNLTSTANFPTDPNQAQPGNIWYRDFPGAADGQLFDAETNTAAPQTVLADNNLDIDRQAVNVYGFEASPIITEVATLYLYTDAPESAGGDPDYSNARPRRAPGGLVTPPPPAVGDQIKLTINGDVDPSNPDFLMACIAFQIHNPWDVPISLGGEGRAQNDALTRMREPNNPNVVDSTTDQYEFEYYIDWKGHFFKLASFERYYAPSLNTANDRRARDSVITGVDNPADDFGTAGGALLPSSGTQYPDFVARNVVLAPGETRVFYAMTDARFSEADSELEVESKWKGVLADFTNLINPYTSGDPTFDIDMDGLPDGKDGRGWTGPSQEWLRDQFSIAGSGEPVMIHAMNPETGEYLDDTLPIDYFGTNGDTSTLTQLPNPLPITSDRVNPDEVRLWRKITTPGEEENDPAFANRITENLLHNDLLVDRIRIDGVAQPLAAGNNEIANTSSFPEDYPNTAQESAADIRNDNIGFGIVKWASSRRKGSPDMAYDGDQFDPLNEHAGQIREWMLSSTSDPLASVVSVRDMYSDTPSATDFRNISGNADNVRDGVGSGPQSDYEVHIEFDTMFTGEPVVVTMALAPYRKDDLDSRAGGNGSGSSAKFDETNAEWTHPNSAVTLHEGGTATPPPAPTRTNLRPQISLRVPTDKYRLSDLLLTTGITAMKAPDDSLIDANATYYADEWVTYTEALAIALGYDQPLSSSTGASRIWADTWDLTPTEDERHLDDLHLAIDRFVPFLNANTSEDPIEFNQGFDRIRGSGAPAALGVLDRARVFDPLGRVTDPVANPPATLGLTRPTFGTININTAPVEVLRLLPGLTPSRAQYYNTTGGAGVAYEWWGNRLTDSEAADTSTLAAFSGGESPSLLKNPDVAAGIVAYRDRVMAAPITGAHATAAGDLYYSSPLNPSVNDEPNNLQSVADNFMTEDPFSNPAILNITLDRRTMTGIEGLRMTPGFGSVGELLAVRLDPELETSDSQAWKNLRNLTMNLYALDDLAQGIQDDATVVPQVFGDSGSYSVGETVDDYAEQLAMASGVLNMVSVRSDYYAVWFVIQGYRESDVANLRPEDPLVPTLQKRFMMVVDRSNVIEPGDKPRIVLLKEVPL